MADIMDRTSFGDGKCDNSNRGQEAGIISCNDDGGKDANALKSLSTEDNVEEDRTLGQATVSNGCDYVAESCPPESITSEDHLKFKTLYQTEVDLGRNSGKLDEENSRPAGNFCEDGSVELISDNAGSEKAEVAKADIDNKKVNIASLMDEEEAKIAAPVTSDDSCTAGEEGGEDELDASPEATSVCVSDREQRECVKDEATSIHVSNGEQRECVKDEATSVCVSDREQRECVKDEATSVCVSDREQRECVKDEATSVCVSDREQREYVEEEAVAFAEENQLEAGNRSFSSTCVSEDIETDYTDSELRTESKQLNEEASASDETGGYESTTAESSTDSAYQSICDRPIVNSTTEYMELDGGQDILADSPIPKPGEDFSVPKSDEVLEDRVEDEAETISAVMDVLNSVVVKVVEDCEKFGDARASESPKNGVEQISDKGETKAESVEGTKGGNDYEVVQTAEASLDSDDRDKGMDVIHILSDEEGDPPSQSLDVDDDDDEIARCDVSFSDAQSSFKKHLDGADSAQPSPQATGSAPVTKGQENNKVCYGDGTFCWECGQSFSLQAYFSDHISIHFIGAVSALGQCALCGLVFTNSLIMAGHLASAQNRMEAAMKVLKKNGSRNRKVQDKSSSSKDGDEGSKSTAAENNPRDSVTSPAPSAEQTPPQSPSAEAEKQTSPVLELPEGAKRKRKAPEKFVSDLSPTIKRRKSLAGTGSSDGHSTEADPEVEAYLRGLMAEGLTVDPAALGLPPHHLSPPPSRSKSTKKSSKGGHTSRIGAYKNQNNSVSVTPGSTGLGGVGPAGRSFLTWSGQRGRGTSNATSVNKTVLPNRNSSQGLPLTQRPNIMNGKSREAAVRFPQVQHILGSSGGRSAVSLLPSEKKTAVAPLLTGYNHFHHGFVKGSPVGLLDSKVPLPVMPQQVTRKPEPSSKAHFVLRTVTASSALIKDSRIDRLRRRRLSRRESHGCKRLRNVHVRMKKLAMPLRAEGEWPVWRLNRGHSDSRTSQIIGQRYQNPSPTQKHWQHPMVSLLQPEPQDRGRHGRVKPGSVDVGSRGHNMLSKVPVNLSRAGSNPCNTKPLKSLLPFSAPFPSNKSFNAKPVQRTKEESRHFVEMMLQSGVSNMLAKSPTISSLPGRVAGRPGTTASPFSSHPLLKQSNQNQDAGLAKKPRGKVPSQHRPVPANIGKSSDQAFMGMWGSFQNFWGGLGKPASQVQRVVVPKGKSPSQFSMAPVAKTGLSPSQKLPAPSNDIIVIDDDEDDNDGSKAPGSSSTLKPFKPSASAAMSSRPLLVKANVEVREITSAEPSVIVDMTSMASTGGTGADNPKAPKEKQDGDLLKPQEDATSDGDEEQDFCGWKVCVAESPEDSDGEECKENTDVDSLDLRGEALDKQGSRSETTNRDSARNKSESSAAKTDSSQANGSEKEEISVSGSTCLSRTNSSEATNVNAVATDPTATTPPDNSKSTTGSSATFQSCKTSSAVDANRPEVSRSVSQSETVSIPAHLDDSSNIQDIFSEIEKTCLEMQKNSEGEK